MLEATDRRRNGTAQLVMVESEGSEVGQVTDFRGDLALQSVVAQGDANHSALGVGSDAIPFAHGRVAKPVVVALPVRAARRIVERDERLAIQPLVERRRCLLLGLVQWRVGLHKPVVASRYRGKDHHPREGNRPTASPAPRFGGLDTRHCTLAFAEGAPTNMEAPDYITGLGRRTEHVERTGEPLSPLWGTLGPNHRHPLLHGPLARALCIGHNSVRAGGR